MKDISKFIENKSIKQVFEESVKRYGENIFLSYPKMNLTKKIKEYSFNEVKDYVIEYNQYFMSINLKHKDRVSVILGNIPEFFIIKLSLNYIGISCVPLNYELSDEELSYIINHSKSKHVITSNIYLKKIENILIKLKKNISISTYSNNKFSDIKIIKRKKLNNTIKVSAKDEASLIYTSGTTGKPKGCILTNFYEINAGYGYSVKKGLVSIRPGKEKIYNCLPVHHVNAGILSFYAVLLTGNCQIQAERFSVNNFWYHIRFSKATIFHYLGVMAPILLKKKKNKIESKNYLRVGIGAGIEPNLHSAFEERFKIPMVELWGMTEMVRCIFDYKKNRSLGNRCFGKPDRLLETKVINNLGDSIIDEEGELLIRHNKSNPKKGFFDGYFNNKKATSKAWKNNWFHTGDIVIKNKRGYLFFIDRKKNIIRRSGENISSAEIEDALLNLTQIKNVAVCAYPHKIYEEEIMAFIILKNKDKASKKNAKNILLQLSKNMAYFKLPGYIQFTNNLPLTSSQKIRKNELIKKIKSQNFSKLYDLCEYKKLFRVN